MAPKSKEQELVAALLSPLTIGDLKLLVEHMDPNLPVFRLAFGSVDGTYDWKRKESWSQWKKKQPPPFNPPPRPQFLSSATFMGGSGPSKSSTMK